jgi:hypothetical protein
LKALGKNRVVRGLTADDFPAIRAEWKVKGSATTLGNETPASMSRQSTAKHETACRRCSGGHVDHVQPLNYGSQRMLCPRRNGRVGGESF